MHEKLTILGVEEGVDRFRVVFEVPGESYGQDYPKRLRHSFPMRDKFFDDVELSDGSVVKRFEQYLMNAYLKDADQEKEKEKCCEKIQACKDELCGKTLEP